MKEPAVADSTTLIGLERIDRLDLLPAIFEPIFIPLAVELEFATSLTWLTSKTISDAGLVAVLGMIVDIGEAEAISLAKENGLLLITDDKQARNAARQLGVQVIGTVGILLRCKDAGLIEAILPLLDGLDACGFRIGPKLRQEALLIANERDD